MPRNLNFTISQGGGKHASTYIEFRLGAEQVAWAYAEVAYEQEKSPRLVTKADAEKRLRRDLWLSGINDFERERDIEVEEHYGEALAHVKAVYGIE
jgi:uncharacterized membrane-anchored protein